MTAKPKRDHFTLVECLLQVRKALTIDSFLMMRRGFSDLRYRYPELDDQIVYENNFNRDGSRGIDCKAEPITPWVYGKTVADTLKNVCRSEHKLLQSFKFLEFEAAFFQ